jgi:hypothetical protein
MAFEKHAENEREIIVSGKSLKYTEADPKNWIERACRRIIVYLWQGMEPKPWFHS